jgi:primosomal protein N' (replication factor Y)
MAYVSPRTKQRSRDLRDQLTNAERRLWSKLRRRQINGWRFRRQHPVEPYIVDFACVEARLIVEADGGQHAESERDALRDRRLRDAGWRVLRFWNSDILISTSDVIDTIAAALGPLPTLPHASRGGGGRSGEPR